MSCQPKHLGSVEYKGEYLAGFYEGRCAEMERMMERESAFARILREMVEAPEPESVEIDPDVQLVIDELTDAVALKAVEIEMRKDEREGRKAGWPYHCSRCRATMRTFLVCVDGEWWYECAECGELSQKLSGATVEHYGLQNAEPEEIETTPENLAEVAESVLQPKESTPSVEDPEPTTQPKDPGKPLSEAIPQRLPSHSAPMVRKQAPGSVAPLPKLPNPNLPWQRKHKPQVYTFAMTCLAEDPHSKAIEIAAQSQREFGPDCLSMKDAENFVAANRTAATLLSNAGHDAKVEWLGEFDRINRIRFERSGDLAK